MRTLLFWRQAPGLSELQVPAYSSSMKNSSVLQHMFVIRVIIRYLPTNSNGAIVNNHMVVEDVDKDQKNCTKGVEVYELSVLTDLHGSSSRRDDPSAWEIARTRVAHLSSIQYQASFQRYLRHKVVESNPANSRLCTAIERYLEKGRVGSASCQNQDQKLCHKHRQWTPSLARLGLHISFFVELKSKVVISSILFAHVLQCCPVYMYIGS